MKPLKNLKGTYGSKDISDLVDFTRQAPVQLPENGQYHFEKEGSTVHIYGVNTGIRKYNLGSLEDGMSLNGIQTTNRGVEIGLKFGEVEKIVLHSKPYSGDLPTTRTGSVRSTWNSESRDNGESQGYTGGESRIVSSESRSDNLGESRQTPVESRSNRFRRSSFSGGESQGGCGGESR